MHAFTQSSLVPLLAKKQHETRPGSPRRPRANPQRRSADHEGPMVLCRACGATIAPACSRMAVNGSHTHVFFNPHGLVFEVSCFGPAPGATPVGRATIEYTWFAGHVWRIALCASCQAHLGWHFQGEGNSFFAFMTKAIREHSSPSKA